MEKERLRHLHHRKVMKHLIVIDVLLAVLLVILLIAYFYPNITGNIIGTQATFTNVKTVTVNFSSAIGTVNPTFYGANTHGSWLGSGTLIDTNGDGTIETPSDLEWHRQAWIDSGMTYMRWDMNLGSYYSLYNFTNPDFEEWDNDTIYVFNSTINSGAVSWKVSTYGGAEGEVYKSLDSHTGTYSLNIAGKKSSHVFLYKDLPFEEGKIYNYSVWVKSNGNFSLLIQRLDNYVSCGSNSFTGNGSSWQQVSVVCNASELSLEGYRMVIDGINPTENVLVDDANLMENEIPYIPRPYFSGNLSSRTSQLQWAYENNIGLLLIINYMPAWMANISSGCNITNSSSSRSTCAPNNYTLFGNIVVDYLNRLTQNGTYSNLDLEVWNEPDIYFWLNNLSTDDLVKSSEYLKLYNSVYDSVKNIYPTISIGGPSLASISNINMLRSFLSNESNRQDSLIIHRYTDIAGTIVLSDVNSVLSMCSNYSANCSRIILSEWNTGSPLIKNSSDQQNAANIADGYASILNTYPQNVSMIIYQWSENEKYGANNNYNEYPQRWSMVSEPNLDSSYYPSYNVTKNFAHYHRSGSIVSNLTSSSTQLKSVASSYAGSQYITIINTGSSQVNVSINFQKTNITSSIIDLETGDIYNMTNGVVTLGSLNGYQIKYFTNSTEPATVSSSSSSSSGGSSSSSTNSDSTTNEESTSSTTNLSPSEGSVTNSESIQKQPETSTESNTNSEIILGESSLFVRTLKSWVFWAVLFFLVIGSIATIIIMKFYKKRESAKEIYGPYFKEYH